MFIMIQEHTGTQYDLKTQTNMDGRSTHDPHWKSPNYKTWNGIFFAHDTYGFSQ